MSIAQKRALTSSQINPAFVEPTRDELAKAGVELVLAPFANADELVEAARGIDGLYESSVHYTRDVLERLPSVRAICALGIGVDRVDLAAATDLGIVVINLPRVFHREVAAHAMALLLGLIRKTGAQDNAIKAWAKAPNGTYLAALGRGDSDPPHLRRDPRARGFREHRPSRRSNGPGLRDTGDRLRPVRESERRGRLRRHDGRPRDAVPRVGLHLGPHAAERERPATSSARRSSG